MGACNLSGKDCHSCSQQRTFLHEHRLDRLIAIQVHRRRRYPLERVHCTLYEPPSGRAETAHSICIWKREIAPRHVHLGPRGVASYMDSLNRQKPKFYCALYLLRKRYERLVQRHFSAARWPLGLQGQRCH
jgi:hypothetical protein